MRLTIGRASKSVVAAALIAALAGCGGSGSGGSSSISSNAMSPAGVASSGAAQVQPTVQHAPVTAPAPANQPPTISGSPEGTLIEGGTYSFQPSTSDADGDTLTFSASGLPGWLTINAGTGLVTGTALAGTAGVYGGIVVSVSDSKTSTSLPAFSITVAAPSVSPAAPAPVNGGVTLTWIAPTKNVDGSALTSLAGYRVRYGQSPGVLTQVVDIPNPGITTARIEGLGAGTWYFTLAAYTNTDVESEQTAAASKTIG